MRIPFLTTALLAACVAASPALAHSYKAGPVEIGHPWTRATPPGAATAGGFLTLHNGGGEADRLLRASSPASSTVEIHQMAVTDGVMTMRAQPDGVAIPPGGDVAFKPGAYHLMLIGLKQPLREGERVPLTLTFEKAGTVQVELAVDKLGAPGPGAASHGDMSHSGMKEPTP